MRPTLQPNVDRRGHAGVVQPRGRLDTTNSVDLEERLKPLLEHAEAAVLDLDGVDFLSGHGTRAPLITARELKSRIARLAILNIRRQVPEVCEMAEIARLLPICENEAGARERLGAGT